MRFHRAGAGLSKCKMRIRRANCIPPRTTAWAARGGRLWHSSCAAGVTIILGQPKARGEHFEVPVTVKNLGDETAEGVTVEVLLQKGGEEEEATFELQYLPQNSTRHGVALFQTDPTGAELRARPLGYEKP